jgi:excisionase family DNA binding protein
MSTSLRISEVCQRLRISRDTAYDWIRKGHLHATRTPTNQLVFDEAEVEALRRGERAPSVAPGTPQSDGRPRVPAWKERPPWLNEVDEARAAIDKDELEFERAERERARRGKQEARARAAEERARDDADWQRIHRLKKQVLGIVCNPREVRAAVVAALEKFASPAQIPAWLSNYEQLQLLIRAHGCRATPRRGAASGGHQATRGCRTSAPDVRGHHGSNTSDDQIAESSGSSNAAHRGDAPTIIRAIASALGSGGTETATQSAGFVRTTLNPWASIRIRPSTRGFPRRACGGSSLVRQHGACRKDWYARVVSGVLSWLRLPT